MQTCPRLILASVGDRPRKKNTEKSGGKEINGYKMAEPLDLADESFEDKEIEEITEKEEEDLLREENAQSNGTSAEPTNILAVFNIPLEIDDEELKETGFSHLFPFIIIL